MWKWAKKLIETVFQTEKKELQAKKTRLEQSFEAALHEKFESSPEPPKAEDKGSTRIVGPPVTPDEGLLYIRLKKHQIKALQEEVKELERTFPNIPALDLPYHMEDRNTGIKSTNSGGWCHTDDNRLPGNPESQKKVQISDEVAFPNKEKYNLIKQLDSLD